MGTKQLYLPLLLMCISCRGNDGNGKLWTDESFSDSFTSSNFIPQERIKRLNLFEYNNTLQALIGVGNPLVAQFPPDPVQDGFDTMASNLSFSPALLGLFFQANQQAVRQAFGERPRFEQRIEAENLQGGGIVQQGWGFELRQSSTIPFVLAQQEVLTIHIQAGGQSYGLKEGQPVPKPVLIVLLDGREVGRAQIQASLLDLQPVRWQITVGPGAHRLTVQHGNFTSHAADAYGNNMVLDWIHIASLAMAPGLGFEKIPSCPKLHQATLEERKACWLSRILTFAEVAFVTGFDGESKQRLVALWEQLNALSEDVESHFTAAIEAILHHPKVLMHISLPQDPVPFLPHLAWRTSGSIAERMAYLVLGSGLDRSWMEQASNLHVSENRHQWLDRLLQDPKANNGLIQGFGTQWLGVRSLSQVHLDPNLFPDVPQEIVGDMGMETEQLLEKIIRQQLPITYLLQSQESFLTKRLAEHYDIPMTDQKNSAWVAIPQGKREGGFLSHGSWLISHASGSRTSPVRRGRFLVEHMLCLTIAPPPPGVPIFEPDLGASNPSAREQLSHHTQIAGCQSCHQQLDPLGLAVDQYDALGRLRHTENGHVIDTSGVFPGTGIEFANTAEMMATFQQDGRFVPCVARKIWTYTFGRSVTPEEEATFQTLVDQWQTTDQSLPTLLHLLIDTPQFLWQQRAQQ